jgi:hypothetical protein
MSIASFRALGLKSRSHKSLATFLSLLLCVGCLKEAQRVKISRLVPARLHLAQFKTMAITEVEGEGGDAVANSMEHLLALATPWQIVDRKMLQQVLAEQGLWGQSTTQPDKIASLLGADVLLAGTTSAHRVEETFSWDTRFGQDGAPYTVYSRTGHLMASASLRGIDASTGIVVGVAHLDASKTLSTDTMRVDGTPQSSPDYLMQLFAPLPETDLLAEADRELAQKLLKAVLPHEEPTEVHVYADARLDESILGIEALERGDFAGAVSLYTAGLKRAETMHAARQLKARARYNLGVALGCQGRYNEATEQVQQASRLEHNPLFSAYLNTLQDYRRDALLLEHQTRELQAVRK